MASEVIVLRSRLIDRFTGVPKGAGAPMPNRTLHPRRCRRFAVDQICPGSDDAYDRERGRSNDCCGHWRGRAGSHGECARTGADVAL